VFVAFKHKLPWRIFAKAVPEKGLEGIEVVDKAVGAERRAGLQPFALGGETVQLALSMLGGVTLFVIFVS
jgi:uncharacterized protein (DUF1684 family)